MIFNVTLEDISFVPFFNISKYFLFAWSVINFLKCLYVTLSITNKRLPPLAVAAIFTGITVAYFIRTRDFTWLLLLQLLDLFLIVHTVLTTRDGIFLLALLSLTMYFLKPFAYIVDVFAILFLTMDLPTAVFENSPSWSSLYVNCLVLSSVIAYFNSHGPAMYKFVMNCLYVCFFWSLSWNSTNRLRSIPVCVTTVIYVLSQFTKDQPLKIMSPEFTQLIPSGLRKFG